MTPLCSVHGARYSYGMSHADDTAAIFVYLLHVGDYDSRTLLGVFATLDAVERAIVSRAFCGGELRDIDVTVEGLDGAEVPQVVRAHLDTWVAERSRGAR